MTAVVDYVALYEILSEHTSSILVQIYETPYLSRWLQNKQETKFSVYSQGFVFPKARKLLDF
jgi:hypothetical protein